MTNKNPLIAFLLAFFPGGGMLYLGKFIRGLFYTAAVFGIPLMAIFLGKVIFGHGDFMFLLGLVFAFLLYIINFIDTVITASHLYRTKQVPADINGHDEAITNAGSNQEIERFFTIILSFIPGLGHFQLGLMIRGVTLLASFIGLGIMVIFISALSSRQELLIFLALLPIIWVFGFFDVMQQLAKKQKGEILVDRSLLEELEMKRDDGKKSKSIATLLSIFPGAGHLYLGLQKRGIQLMAAFLFSIYILDALRLGLFLFIVPIIWFYSFFDGMQRASKYNGEPQEDTPIISYLVHQQKWVGIGLIFVGFYYLLKNLVMPIAEPYFSNFFNMHLTNWFDTYFQTAVISILFIVGGIYLMKGKKRERNEREEDTE
ncbi:hypothetical protein [Bacillus chungangensis]|uniref:TM2 domain-containing membrane protein YozV n=1 Tax=Bacillus chungangensis TaxID=587633 RepID=A0ABT9WS55_9BACI|nr:hypothetical protein [Bacillus chungangensis]MDQ0176052.1 TM2 domain-containing membrane protein YozV [Bacillus chungangensis]